MSDVKIRTNNVPRDIIDAYELTEAERAEFDDIDWAEVDAGNASPGFMRYKGRLYDLSEFMTTRSGSAGGPDEFRKWDGYTNDTYFSGLLVRFVDNGERVIVATFYS
jgi:hypothetical protein